MKLSPVTCGNGKTSGPHGVVIVGGGLAGQRCAETLRRHAFDGPIRLICAEAHRPYDRPPLSKGALAATGDAESLAYRPSKWYEQHAVDLMLGVRATGLRRAERRVLLSDGRALKYDWLLVATGSRPRELPLLTGYENVSALRTLDDCVGLRAAIARPRRLVIVGAGFIGQEVAATARRLGSEVTMIEATAFPLAGMLGRQLGEWFARLHREEGIRVICRRTVDRVGGETRVRWLELSDGRRIPADHVVVGVGVEPDTSWLQGSGLETGAGVRVDEHGRSVDRRVLAAGDAACTFDRRLGHHVSGSHWEAAGRQGASAGRAILGLDPGRVPLSSFWTDQHGIRIQYIGHAQLADGLELDGDLGTRSFTARFTRAGRPVGALIVDRPRELAAIRNDIERGEP